MLAPDKQDQVLQCDRGAPLIKPTVVAMLAPDKQDQVLQCDRGVTIRVFPVTPRASCEKAL